MLELLGKIKGRLAGGAFGSEAAVSHGILIPILQRLGWDPAEPDQFVPEFTTGRGRVDFALCTGPRRPAVFVEVKGVGRSLEGDRQLFEYAFHEGVPLCVLTDGREWSFYLPSGQGSYEERRVYRLQLDDREPADSAETLRRYLEHDRVKSGAALEAATTDYRNASAKREAARSLPMAWDQLVTGPEELLIDLLSDQSEAICGYRPTSSDVVSFLRLLAAGSQSIAPPVKTPLVAAHPPERFQREPPATTAPGRSVSYVVLGENRKARDGNSALIDVLTCLARRDLALVPRLAAAVRGNTRNHIAQSVQEIYPARPDLARGTEFTPGWLVGTNIANREKVRIIRAACEVYGLRFGRDVVFELPNA